MTDEERAAVGEMRSRMMRAGWDDSPYMLTGTLDAEPPPFPRPWPGPRQGPLLSSLGLLHGPPKPKELLGPQ